MRVDVLPDQKMIVTAEGDVWAYYVEMNPLQKSPGLLHQYMPHEMFPYFNIKIFQVPRVPPTVQITVTFTEKCDEDKVRRFLEIVRRVEVKQIDWRKRLEMRERELETEARIRKKHYTSVCFPKLKKLAEEFSRD